MIVIMLMLLHFGSHDNDMVSVNDRPAFAHIEQPIYYIVSPTSFRLGHDSSSQQNAASVVNVVNSNASCIFSW